MRKTFLKVSLLAVLGLGMSASFTSCKDYDSEIDDLQSQLNQLKSTVDKINADIAGGAVITSVSQNADGVTFTLSNNQTYTVTNGKDGAAGKDADVWTIEKNAEGALYWAKNGVITEYPAQGPAGENGTAQPGIYYRPNEKTGKFDIVNPTTGEVTESDISWRGNGGGLSAVSDGNKVIISGILNEKGEKADDVVIYYSMLVKGLVVMPELYLNGIEAARYDDVTALQAKNTVPAGDNVTANIVNGNNKLSATVAKGEPSATTPKYKSGAPVMWDVDVIETLNYRLNPNNAALPELEDWSLLFDDIEVAVTNRSGNVGEITGIEKNEDGNLAMTYKLTKGAILPNHASNAGFQQPIDTTYVADGKTVRTAYNRILAIAGVDETKTFVVTPAYTDRFGVEHPAYEEPIYRTGYVRTTVTEEAYNEYQGQKYTTTNDKGEVTGYYVLSADEVPYFNPKYISIVGTTNDIFYNTAIYVAPTTNSWTFMALQTQVEGGQVTSDNVALLATNVDLLGIYVDQKVPAAPTAVNAIEAPLSTNNVKTVTLPAQYNKAFDLESHLSVNISKLTPQVDNKASDNTQNTGNPNLDGSNVNFAEISYKKAQAGWLTFDQVEAQYGLKPNYQIVKYHVGGYDTDEDQFGQVNATSGVVTPYYVDANAQMQPVPATGSAGRSAIGRSPMVYVTLNDNDGNIVLAGFVKVEWQDLGLNDKYDVVLNTTAAKAPYICNWQVASTWEQISGKVYEALEMSPEQFKSLYQGAESVVYLMKEDGTFAKASDIYKNPTRFQGSFSGLDDLIAGTNTQGLVFSLTPGQYATWYDYNAATKQFVVSDKEVSQTVYCRVKLATGYVYLGFNVTLVGAPAQDYTGKLKSQWTSDLKVAPINPAVPGQTTTQGVQDITGYDYASAMSMSFKSVWNGGVPTPVAKDPYNWSNAKAPYLLGNIVANYNFNAEQADVEGNSGTIYAVSTNPYPLYDAEDKAQDDYQSLWAAAKVDGAVPANAQWQPIAIIMANDAANAGHSNKTYNAATKAATWDIISMLPAYKEGVNGDVITPGKSDWNSHSEAIEYAEYACDIVNAKQFDKNAPAITFNVDMVVTYGQVKTDADGKYIQDAEGNYEYMCTLTIPGSYDIEVGIGRPLALNNATGGALQDAVNSKVNTSSLFSMVDWQGNLLWSTSKTGVITEREFNGQNLVDFWFSNAAECPVVWPAEYPYKDAQGNVIPCLQKGQISIDVENALVGENADMNVGLLGLFHKVYVNRELVIMNKNNTPNDDDDTEVTNDEGLKVLDVDGAVELNNYYIKWVNNGNAVTSNIYVFVPVYINYIWGQNVLLGYATITVQPTLQGN